MITKADNTFYDVVGIGNAIVDVLAKVRSFQEPFKVHIKPLENGKYQVDFLEPQKAVAVGQSVVFYDKDMVLGGGFIEK